MANDFDRAKDIYNWNKNVMNILGVWPLHSTYIKFTIWIVYFVMHMSMEFIDLYLVFGNLELMVVNLSESALEVMIFAKLILLRFSQPLVKLMTQILDGIDARCFESAEERKAYMNYNSIARNFFKMWVVMGVSTAVMYFLKPLELRLRSALSNETLPFVLPYRAHFFITVDGPLTYWLIYAYQIPMVYVHMFHAVAISYLFSLVLHICGLLSGLAHRIKNLEVGYKDNPRDAKIIFQDIVERHCNITRLARDLDEVFHLILMEELILSTLVLGLTFYSAIVHSDFTDKVPFVSFLLYASVVLLLIYGYCVAGEYLITESMNVYEAYYQCQWQDVSTSFKKQLIICMVGASKPLKLTAGGFYIFSLESYTGVIKTAGGYISMLRNIVD